MTFYHGLKCIVTNNSDNFYVKISSLQLPCPSQYGKGVFLFKIKNPSTAGNSQRATYERRSDKMLAHNVILLVILHER